MTDQSPPAKAKKPARGRSRRRANGEGTVALRADGRWVATLTVGRDASGRLIRRSGYGHSQKEAIEKLERMRSEAAQGVLLEPDRSTVAEYLDRWVEDAARPSVSKSTYRSYRGVVDNHLAPVIGGIKLRQLSAVNVQSMLAELERRGASPRTRQMSYAVLQRALGQAVRWGLIASNACAGVDPPKVPRKEFRVLDAAEARRLIAAASGDRLEALLVLAICTGMRQGELLGLQWRDIDFARSSVTVRRQLSEGGAGGPELAELKTEKSRRSIALPASAIESLRRHRERCSAEPMPTALLFTADRGGPIFKRNLLRRWFYPLLERAGLPRVRFHDLRHTHASLLLAEGVHPKVVQERLGHSQVSVTLDVYSHVAPSLQVEAAAKVEALLGS